MKDDSAFDRFAKIPDELVGFTGFDCSMIVHSASWTKLNSRNQNNTGPHEPFVVDDDSCRWSCPIILKREKNNIGYENLKGCCHKGSLNVRQPNELSFMDILLEI